jgi:hypothetical protein
MVSLASHSKGKVALPLCLIKHHVMTTYGGLELHLQAFLTTALHGGKLVSFISILLHSRGKNVSTNWIGCWVDLREIWTL